MNAAERGVVWLAAVAVVGSGVGYGAMRYALEPEDEWSVVNHPWQPHLQHLHVVVAPLLVFAGGLLWREHVRRHLVDGRPAGRWTGLAMVGAFLPMAFSGGLIQIAASEGWRTVWIVVHVAASVVWTLAFALHPVLRRRRPQTGPETLGPSPQPHSLERLTGSDPVPRRRGIG